MEESDLVEYKGLNRQIVTMSRAELIDHIAVLTRNNQQRSVNINELMYKVEALEDYLREVRLSLEIKED